MRRQIWVDFNDLDEQGRARTLLRFAEPGVNPSVGDQFVGGDDEGNQCIVEVVDLRPSGEVVLDLDLTTFEPAEELRQAL